MYASSTMASLIIASTSSVVGALTAYFVLNEQLTHMEFLGSGLILIGIVITYFEGNYNNIFLFMIFSIIHLPIVNISNLLFVVFLFPQQSDEMQHATNNNNNNDNSSATINFEETQSLLSHRSHYHSLSSSKHSIENDNEDLM
jgi:hypothetical protein